MPQRFYYDDNNYWNGGTSNPATPAYHSGWHDLNGALRVSLKQGHPGNAFSNMTIQKSTAGSPKYGLHRVYVSDPLPQAFTLSGTVRGQMMCVEQNAANDAMRAVVIRIWNSATNTFRAPAVLVHLPSALESEYSAVGTINHFFPPETSITPVNVLKGDRIVVEVGTAFFAAGTGAGITSQLETGNPSIAADLPIDESYTVPQRVSWIEFSMAFPGAVQLSPGVIRPPGAGEATGGGAAKFLFELTAPTGQRYDVTDRVPLDGLATISLLIERNLHQFRAGDIDLTLDDGDGFFSDLFEGIKASDRWHLTVDRDGARHFAGLVPGIDSIRFKKKDRLCEVHALDLSKGLEDVPSDGVSRPDNIYALGANISISNTTITLNSTAGLFNTDRFSVTEDGVSEEFTIALILSSTQVQVTSGAANAFTAAGATVQLVTKFYRFATPNFLVNALLDEAGNLINGRSVDASAPFAGSPIFSEASTQGLPSTAVPNAFLQKAAKHFVRVGSAVFDQLTPDANWASAGTDRQWIDWSPYRTQAEGEPATFATTTGALDPEVLGVDLTPGALVLYRVAINPGDSRQVILNKYTSADGITWAGPSLVSTLGDNLVLGFDMHFASGDYDSVRNRVYYAWDGDLGSQFGYWDVAGAARVILDTSDARAIAANGNVRYSKEFDGLVVYNSTQKVIEIWRGTSIVLAYSGGLASNWSPKQTRYFNGVWYTVGYPQGIPSVLFSNDNFANVQQILLAGKPAGGVTTRHLTIVNGTVRVVVNAAPNIGTTAIARYYVASSTDQWTIAYADFSGQSLINSLDDIAIVLNAVFFIDAQGVAHFHPRRGDSGTEIKVLDDLILEQEEDPVWLELYDYVEFTLPAGGIASAGQKTSVSRNLTVQVQFVSTDVVAASIATTIHSFFSKERRHLSLELFDDGTVYNLLDPVRIFGSDWLVYSVDRDLLGFELRMEVIEKLEDD